MKKAQDAGRFSERLNCESGTQGIRKLSVLCRQLVCVDFKVNIVFAVTIVAESHTFMLCLMLARKNEINSVQCIPIKK